MKPKYTFLLPAYKGHFLDEMLRSIRSQTYTDYKVIISDDCSPEDLYGICKPYLSDSRFSYRRNEKNIGGGDLVAHWNLLVDMCDTEYLIMASDDDVYESLFLEEIDKLTVKYPQVNLFRGRVDNINTDGYKTKEDKQLPEFENNRQFLESHFSDGNLKCVGNHVFSTKKLKEINGFHTTPLAWYSDQITAIEMSDNGCGNTKGIVFHFRLSNENISGRKSTKEIACKKAYATIYADRWFKEYLKKRNIVGFKYNRWGRMIYYWLMDADFLTFLKLYPQVISLGLWNTDWMMAITRHQIKLLISKEKVLTLR